MIEMTLRYFGTFFHAINFLLLKTSSPIAS
jgi:hypothetical protein